MRWSRVRCRLKVTGDHQERRKSESAGITFKPSMYFWMVLGRMAVQSSSTSQILTEIYKSPLDARDVPEDWRMANISILGLQRKTWDFWSSKLNICGMKVTGGDSEG